MPLREQVIFHAHQFMVAVDHLLENTPGGPELVIGEQDYVRVYDGASDGVWYDRGQPLDPAFSTRSLGGPANSADRAHTRMDPPCVGRSSTSTTASPAVASALIAENSV